MPSSVAVDEAIWQAIYTPRMFTRKCHFKLNKYLFAPIVRRIKKRNNLFAFRPFFQSLLISVYLFIYERFQCDHNLRLHERL